MTTVREFARLSLDPGVDTLDEATVDRPSFDWLVQHGLGNPTQAGVVSYEGPRTLRVANFVGVLETPAGWRLEILPKFASAGDEVAVARRSLIEMLTVALRLKPRFGGDAHISATTHPLPEWLALRLLQEVVDLVRRGLRQTYQPRSARERFLRGSLDVARQIRRGPGAAHLIEQNHDIYTVDRPENRVIRSAILLILRTTRDSDNWRLAGELNGLLSDVPESRNVTLDLANWRKDRLLVGYDEIERLCRLVLTKQSPFAFDGQHLGLSLLFPMELLFQQYVASCIRKALPPDFEIVTQSPAFYLCRHLGADHFALKPDIVVTGRNGHQWVLDTKWKLLSRDSSKHYGIRRDDIYQMLAYGSTYLNGSGDLFLIYPKTSEFDRSLPAFEFSPKMRVHPIPFDLETKDVTLPFLIGV